MFLKQSLDSQGNFCWGLWSCFEHYIVRINRSAVNLTNSHTTVVLLVVCGCLSVIALTMANSYLSPPSPPSFPPPPTSSPPPSPPCSSSLFEFYLQNMNHCIDMVLMVCNNVRCTSNRAVNLVRCPLSLCHGRSKNAFILSSYIQAGCYCYIAEKCS